MFKLCNNFSKLVPILRKTVINTNDSIQIRNFLPTSHLWGKRLKIYNVDPVK